jgi:hypothetical protein
MLCMRVLPGLRVALSRLFLLLRPGSRLGALGLGLASGVAGAGCAHGESFEQGVLRKGALTVHLGPVPAGWQRVFVEGADVAYRDQARDGSTLFDVRCHARDDDAPLSVLTEHLIMGTTDRELDAQDVVPFDGREAMHTLMRAKLDGVPMQYDIYVMKKDGCVYDLVYVALPDRYTRGAEDFERFARGLHASSPPVAVGAGARAAPPASDP